MRNIIKEVLIFAAGAISGGVTVYLINKRSNAEFNAEESSETEEDISQETPEEKAENLVEYNSIASSYTSTSEKPTSGRYEWGKNEVVTEEDSEEVNEGDSMTIIEDFDITNEPYEIDDVDDFGEKEGYNTQTLYYYADGVIADGDDKVLQSPEDVLGFDIFKLMDDEDTEAAYIRNDLLATDYEVLYCNRPFSV